MSARSKARKRAIDMLYAADIRGLGLGLADVVAAEAARAASEPDRQASWLYARELVDGVADHREEIDELIRTYSQGWAIERMPAVDRAILRIGVWEIVYNDAVPDAVAIDEAVSAAGSLSTEASPGFVNGLLGRISAVA